jgi:hypothetical protein
MAEAIEASAVTRHLRQLNNIDTPPVTPQCFVQVSGPVSGRAFSADTVSSEVAPGAVGKVP